MNEQSYLRLQEFETAEKKNICFKWPHSDNKIWQKIYREIELVLALKPSEEKRAEKNENYVRILLAEWSHLQKPHLFEF